MKKILVVLCLSFFVSCKKNNYITKETNSDFENKELINNLLNNALERGDTIAYQELFEDYIFAGHYEDFFCTTIKMINRHENFSQPYFDAYYLLTYGEFNFNSRKKLSYYFLIKAYEKGNQDAISVVLYKKHENEDIVINSDYYKNIIISSNDVLPCELRNYFNN